MTSSEDEGVDDGGDNHDEGIQMSVLDIVFTPSDDEEDDMGGSNDDEGVELREFWVGGNVGNDDENMEVEFLVGEDDDDEMGDNEMWIGELVDEILEAIVEIEEI